MSRLFYALHDSDPKSHPMTQIRYSDAKDFNARGYGIFWTVQEFDGTRRIANLKRIRSWAVDMDEGSKDEMVERLRAGLVPSAVVESSRGFHVYWHAYDAKVEHWDAIVLERLVPFYNADRNARDLARVLRVPGFYHLKNPAKPFLIQKVWEWPVIYSELQMAAYYPAVAERERANATHQIAKRIQPVQGGFWDKVWHLNCEFALERLSGHPAVNGETYSFRLNGSGTKNIYVDGKPTSAWVDREGRIGSLSGGGPTVFQWLVWFGHPSKHAVSLIQELFPDTRT